MCYTIVTINIYLYYKFSYKRLKGKFDMNNNAMNNGYTPAQKTSTGKGVPSNSNKAIKIILNVLGVVLPIVICLAPAFIISIYGILEASDILPSRIYIGNTRIRLVGLFENDFMTLLSVFSYVLCPFIGFAISIAKLISIFDKRSAEKEAAAEQRAQSKKLFVQPQETYEKSASNSESNQYGAAANDAVVAEIDYQAVTENAQNAQDDANQESEEKKVIPPRPDMLVYYEIQKADVSNQLESRPAFTEQFTFEELADNFVAYLAENGVDMPMPTARRLFASMAASRCLWISGKNGEAITKATTLLAKYFGTDVSAERILDMQYSTVDLSFGYNGSTFYESKFLVDVYKANHRKDYVSFAALNGDFANIGEQTFAPYLNSADIKNRVRTVSVAIPNSVYRDPLTYIVRDQMILPSNVWYLIISADATCAAMPEGAIAIDLGSVALRDASVANAEAGGDEVAAESKRRILPSEAAFVDLVRRAKDEKFISEEYWKKLDAVEEYVSSKVSGYRMSNKSVRSIERYAAVALSMNGTVYETLDGVVAGILIPVLSKCEREAIAGNEDGISAFIDKTFGIDNMPFTNEILRKFGV